MFVQHRSPAATAKDIGLNVKNLSVVILELPQLPAPQIASLRIAENVNQLTCIYRGSGEIPINLTGGFW